LGQYQIFYGFVAAVSAGVAAVLWRNYRTWRAWQDDYKKQGSTLTRQTPAP